MQLTSRERIEAAHAHQAPDRTPFFEYVLLSPIADLVLGRNYPDYQSNDPLSWSEAVHELGFEGAVRGYASDRLEIAHKLRHDMMYVVPNPPDRRSTVPPSTPVSQPPPEDPVE